MRRQTRAYPALLLIPGALLMLLPFVWMLASAFSKETSAFADVFRMVPFLRYLGNSLLTAFLQTLLTMLLSVLSAYALTRLTFPGKRLFQRFLLSSLFIPVAVTMVPLYVLVSSIGLSDTYAGIVLPQIHTAFSTFFLARAFAGVPEDLTDMAALDGCSHFGVLFRVILPQTGGAVRAAAFFTFLSALRSYTWPLLITTDTAHRTLPIGLKYLTAETASEYPVMMAAALLSMLPALAALVILERKLLTAPAERTRRGGNAHA